MKTTIDRLRQLISEELLREQGEQPFRTGLSAAGWTGVGDPRGSGADTETFPETEAERLGEVIADAVHNSIRDALQAELGEKGLQIYEAHAADIDDPVLDVSMYMRDAALGLLGQPEGVLAPDEGEQY